MNKTKKIGRYLDYEEMLSFKRLIIVALSEVSYKTDLGYYYSVPKMSNIINNKIEKIFISNTNISNLFKIQDNILILDKKFSSLNLKTNLKALINNETYLSIKVKELGLNLIAHDNLNTSLKSSLSLFFASSKQKEMKEFYNRKFYTSLPFMDLRLNVINILNDIFGEDMLAHTLCYGDLNLSNELDDLCSRRSVLKSVIKYLDKITLIQNKISKQVLNYTIIDNIRYKFLVKINAIKKSQDKKEQIELLQEICDINFEITNSDIYKEMIITKEEDTLDNIQKKKNLEEKTQIILNFIKQDINKKLNVLDKEYIAINNFLVNNILNKFLKMKRVVECDETKEIFKNLEYKIGEEYSYLEEAKATKKIKKRLEKNQ